MRERGYYGEFGGAYIPESTFEDARKDPSFWREYTQMLSRYSCGPTITPPLVMVQSGS